MLIVTTGSRFCDIDGLACVIAYKEIPEVPAIPVIVGPLNNSVTLTIRNWKPEFKINFEPSSNDNFVIVDVSEPKEFPNFVNKDRVIEIYDHHFDKEKFWSEKLGDKAIIEPVGACATLIWELFTNKLNTKYLIQNTVNSPISTLSANLLYTAILSNTLAFKASIATTRDKKAFEELKPFTKLPEDWHVTYFQDQEAEYYRDPYTSLINDTKMQIIKGEKVAVGQAELWNSKEFLNTSQNEIESVLRTFQSENWLLISPSISEGRTYIFTRSSMIKDLLRSVLMIDFFGTDIGVTDRLWLRKEILKKIQ